MTGSLVMCYVFNIQHGHTMERDMWRWDQGHLPYFQFDTIRRLSELVVASDFKTYDKNDLFNYTGLEFRAPATHTPWRNYARVIKLCLLAYENNNRILPTRLANLISQPGRVTCDEYFHFLVRAFTDSSPAFGNWKPPDNPRYPLLFSLKYVLSKYIVSGLPATIAEIIGAYLSSGYSGDETDEEFIRISQPLNTNEQATGNIQHEDEYRQAAESIRVISQISYLTIVSNSVLISLDAADAREIFDSLNPIIGPFSNNRNTEIERLASLYACAVDDVNLDYKNTSLDETISSGFIEGGKIERTHITIERNKNLINEFFRLKPTSICDLCGNDTSRMYPWTDRIIDLHHILPLSSGTRAEAHGTSLDDLVAICPSCHRAVHRFYHTWLTQNNKRDFDNKDESVMVYGSIRQNIYAERQWF